MRKLYLLIPVILSLAITFPTFADDVEEVVVVGTRPGGSAWGSGRGGTPTGPRKDVNVDDSGGGLEALRRRKACIAAADATGAECASAYNQLNGICTGVNGAIGVVGGLAAKKFFEKVGVELSEKLNGAIVAGAGVGGIKAEDSIIPCDTLTKQAMAFCASGAAKMKAACN
jgi:hypothetical protein